MHHRGMEPASPPARALRRAAVTAEPQGQAARLWARVATGLLALLALVLPFEAPLFRLGPLQITSVEIVLYATVAGWGLAMASEWARDGLPARLAIRTWSRDAMTQAAAVWLVVPFAAALAAPEFKAAALKFALRSASGVFLFFAARTLCRSPGVATRITRMLIAGALVSAATATLEGLLPSSAAAWAVFHETQFDALGLARAAGVFAYPTIGAMYWEAAVPLVIASLAAREGRARPMGGLCSVALATALLVAAILASGTRSGLAGAGAAGAGLLALAWRSSRNARGAAITALGVMAVASAAFALATGSGSQVGARLRWWHDGEWLRAEYRVDETRRALRPRESFRVPITLRNTGAVTWPRSGERPVHLAYHWERTDGPSTLADYEGLRTPLPADVPPGGKIEVVALAQAPSVRGAYRLRWDLAQEHTAWFSDRGNPMPAQPVEIQGEAQSGTLALSASELQGPPTVAPQPPSRLALWRAAVLLWSEHPLLGIGPDNFRRRYEAVLSPAPNGQPYTDARIHANSLFFETLADLGLVGLAGLALIARALVLSLARHAAAGWLAGIGAGVAAGAFFVHGALDYFFEFTPLFGLFWLLLGLTACHGGRPSSETPPGSQPSERAR
ncbi:MAG: O-antigen ligase family protein [Myxococcota bacterium]|nr:O-antigen ligase family protein [Myxococcota bacterium]